ncbi:MULTISPECIES: hypothetical protein [unclassified Streptomyces]|uniref:hypothetical protein n=1 Tax=unclassified Streptomyces TaxID=2593676 RepID=UPI003431E95E
MWGGGRVVAVAAGGFGDAAQAGVTGRALVGEGVADHGGDRVPHPVQGVVAGGTRSGGRTG